MSARSSSASRIRACLLDAEIAGVFTALGTGGGGPTWASFGGAAASSGAPRGGSWGRAVDIAGQRVLRVPPLGNQSAANASSRSRTELPPPGRVSVTPAESVRVRVVPRRFGSSRFGELAELDFEIQLFAV